MTKKFDKLVSVIAKDWERFKKIQENPKFQGDGPNELGIRVWWENSEMVWVFSTNNEEGYEGSQTMLGVTKEGKVYWSYQSHCSCNGYEAESDLTNSKQFTEPTEKIYELQTVPEDWEKAAIVTILKLIEERKRYELEKLKN